MATSDIDAARTLDAEAQARVDAVALAASSIPLPGGGTALLGSAAKGAVIDMGQIAVQGTAATGLGEAIGSGTDSGGGLSAWSTRHEEAVLGAVEAGRSDFKESAKNLFESRLQAWQAAGLPLDEPPDELLARFGARWEDGFVAGPGEYTLAGEG